MIDIIIYTEYDTSFDEEFNYNNGGTDSIKNGSNSVVTKKKNQSIFDTL